MLDSMRGLAKSFVAKGLMLLLVLSFALWGVGDMLRNHGNGYLVKVGDSTITPQQFMNEQQSMQRAMEQMGVRGIDPRALSQQVLQRMIQQRLIAQWQHDTGLVVNEQTLANEVAQNAEFKGLNGKFDKTMFAQSLQMRQMNEAMYRRQLAEELGGKAMLSGIDSSDIDAPKSVVAMGVAAGTQTRDAVLITVPALSNSEVSEADIQSYYDQHKSNYAEPERRTLEYVTLDKPKQGQSIDDLSMQIEDALAGGSSIGEAVASAGLEAKSKMLTDVTKDQFANSRDALTSAVVAQGFEVEEGESSSLMTAANGQYFLVSVKSVTPEAPKKLELVKAEVRDAVAKENARSETRARVQALKKALGNGITWQEAAKEAKATGREVRNINRPVVGTDGKVKEVGTVPPLLQEAIFEHGVGSVAGPMVRDNGEQVVAVVTAIHHTPAIKGGNSEAAEAEYRTQLGNAVMSGMFGALAERYKVDINMPLLAQLTQSDAPHE